LIDYCLSSSQQYFSYIQEENKMNETDYVSIVPVCFGMAEKIKEVCLIHLLIIVLSLLEKMLPSKQPTL
jgi:hypothetical protein